MRAAERRDVAEKGEDESHGMRHYNLCMAVDGLKLGMVLDVIKAAGADPELCRMGEALIREGRQLLFLANDRVGDGNRLCVGSCNKGCGLLYNHAGECRDLPLPPVQELARPEPREE